MTNSEHYRYTKDHDWVTLDGDIATVGISNFAQQGLSDIVYIELPELDKPYSIDQAVAMIEVRKAAFDIYAPLDGTIIEVNKKLETTPSLVNEAAESAGWLYKLKLSDTSQFTSLMDSESYQSMIKED